jgi:ABC-type transporter Mla MlaB component
MESLRIEATEIPDTVRLVGELDIANVERVQARLKKELTDNQELTLDTSQLAFIDSQGLRMLIELGEEANERGLRDPGPELLQGRAARPRYRGSSGDSGCGGGRCGGP